MSTTLTPTPWHVFNELDSHGLLLGLPRLSGEKNTAYKQRLLDVYVHKASSVYLGIIHGVTRELGYSIANEFSVSFEKNSDGSFVYAEPAITIEENIVKLYSDYTNNVVKATFDTWLPISDSYTIQGLVNQINTIQHFTAFLSSSASRNNRAATLFNQTSVVLVEDEDISEFDTFSELYNDYIVSNSVSVISSSLLNRVDNLSAVQTTGDYYVDTQHGIIRSYNSTSPGTRVWYRYIDDNFVAQSSPVIPHNLQSEIFKTRMFIQQVGSDGNNYNGVPTALGSEIINELMSVFPMKFKE